MSSLTSFISQKNLVKDQQLEEENFPFEEEINEMKMGDQMFFNLLLFKMKIHFPRQDMKMIIWVFKPIL